jgi:hypothetical protein
LAALDGVVHRDCAAMVGGVAHMLAPAGLILAVAASVAVRVADVAGGNATRAGGGGSADYVNFIERFHSIDEQR